MTNQTKKLYWTADSPFCRIVVWALAESNPQSAVPLDSEPLSAFGELVHLNWDDIRKSQTSGVLGPEGTVPTVFCEGDYLTDSLRLLASLQPHDFSGWLTSSDGALYRCAEGQLGRVMYALYDVVDSEKAKKLWFNALHAIEKLVNISATHRTENAVSWGIMATQTFLNFCLALKPEWKKDLSETLWANVIRWESSRSFQDLKNRVNQHPHRVPCGLSDGPDAAGAAGAGLPSSV